MKMMNTDWRACGIPSIFSTGLTGSTGLKKIGKSGSPGRFALPAREKVLFQVGMSVPAHPLMRLNFWWGMAIEDG